MYARVRTNRTIAPTRYGPRIFGAAAISCLYGIKTAGGPKRFARARLLPRPADRRHDPHRAVVRYQLAVMLGLMFDPEDQPRLLLRLDQLVRTRDRRLHLAQHRRAGL